MNLKNDLHTFVCRSYSVQIIFKVHILILMHSMHQDVSTYDPLWL